MINELEIEREADRANMLRKRLEDAIKISSAPAEPVALLIPHYPWNENYVDPVEALWSQKLWLGFGNVEASRRELFSEVLDLGEKEVNISFLYDRN